MLCNHTYVLPALDTFSSLSTHRPLVVSPYMYHQPNYRLFLVTWPEVLHNLIAPSFTTTAHHPAPAPAAAPTPTPVGVPKFSPASMSSFSHGLVSEDICGLSRLPVVVSSSWPRSPCCGQAGREHIEVRSSRVRGWHIESKRMPVVVSSSWPHSPCCGQAGHEHSIKVKH